MPTQRSRTRVKFARLVERADRHQALGDRLSDEERMARALRHFVRARDLCRSLVRRGSQAHRGALALAHHSIAETLVELGRYRDSLRSFERAKTLYRTLASAGQREHEIDTIRVQAGLAGAWLKRGELQRAISQYVATIAALESLHTPFDCRGDVADAHLNLGEALMAAEDLPAALIHFRTALAGYRVLQKKGHSPARGHVALARMNIGMALTDQGKLRAARVHLTAAVSVFRELIDAGETQYRANAARALDNLGNCAGEQGDLAGSLVHYVGSARTYDECLTAGSLQLTAESAGACMNVGTALSDLGEGRRAVEHYELALARYRSLIKKGQTEYRAHAADVLANISAILADQTLPSIMDLNRAAREGRTALATYESLLDDGFEQYRTDAARAHLNIAVAFALRPDFARAKSHYRGALALFEQLIDGGADQYRVNAAVVRRNIAQTTFEAGGAVDALNQFAQVMQLWRDLRRRKVAYALSEELATMRLGLRVALDLIGSGSPDDDVERGTQFVRSLRLRCADLARSLRHAQLRDSVILVSLTELLEICLVSCPLDKAKRSERWRESALPIAEHCYAAWLVLVRTLLSEGRPHYLLSQAKDILDCVDGALAWRLETHEHDASAALLDWILHTQSLRTGRNFVLDSSGTSAEVAALWDQVDRLDRTALGEKSHTLAYRGEGVLSKVAFRALTVKLAQRDALIARLDVLTRNLTRFPLLEREQLKRQLRAGEEAWLLYPQRNTKRARLLVLQLRVEDGSLKKPKASHRCCARLWQRDLFGQYISYRLVMRTRFPGRMQS